MTRMRDTNVAPFSINTPLIGGNPCFNPNLHYQLLTTAPQHSVNRINVLTSWALISV